MEVVSHATQSAPPTTYCESWIVFASLYLSFFWNHLGFGIQRSKTYEVVFFGGLISETLPTQEGP